METTILTRQEALSQGYEYCGHPYHEWQSLQEINDLGGEDFESNEWVLFSKESNCFSLDPDTVKERIQALILDMVIQEELEANCDTSIGTDTLKGMDWEQFTSPINFALENGTYYYLTDIKLIP